MFIKIKPVVGMICILLQLLTLFSCRIKEDNGLTELQKQLVQELNQWLIPLVPSPLNLTDSELSFLDLLRDSKVVALGEATHGTREFFQMKHRIFQYLVEYCQHKAFGFEADFGESIYLNNYVTKEDGSRWELLRPVYPLDHV
jgi:erythromycin esterase